MCMEITKLEIKNIFGGRLIDVADALDVTIQAVSQWREPLTQERQDRSIGAAIRLNKAIPDGVMAKFSSRAK